MQMLNRTHTVNLPEQAHEVVARHAGDTCHVIEPDVAFVTALDEVGCERNAAVDLGTSGRLDAIECRRRLAPAPLRGEQALGEKVQLLVVPLLVSDTRTHV